MISMNSLVRSEPGLVTTLLRTDERPESEPLTDERRPLSRLLLRLP